MSNTVALFWSSKCYIFRAVEKSKGGLKYLAFFALLLKFTALCGIPMTYYVLLSLFCAENTVSCISHTGNNIALIV